MSDAEPEAGVSAAERDLFRQLANIVGAAAKERESLSPDDLLVLDDSQMRETLLIDYSDAAAQHISEGTAEPTVRALRGLASFALPVLTRMPARSVEDRDKRRAAAESLLFASTLTPTRTLFVVSSENESSVTFRLHHQLIERLQRGCEDLVTLLKQPITVADSSVRFEFQGPIEIYEVGQEDATILGDIIGTSTGRRFRYAYQRDRPSYIVLLFLILLFVALFLLLWSQHLANPSALNELITIKSRQYLRRSDDFWVGQAQRLESGVVPVMLVTALTLLVRFPRGIVVKWTQRYSGTE